MKPVRAWPASLLVVLGAAWIVGGAIAYARFRDAVYLTILNARPPTPGGMDMTLLWAEGAPSPLERVLVALALLGPPVYLALRRWLARGPADRLPGTPT